VAEVTEVRRGETVAYSTDVEQYDPMCRPCHHDRDGNAWTSERYEASGMRAANDRRKAEGRYDLPRRAVEPGPQPLRVTDW
jgi:hypothetical protein